MRQRSGGQLLATTRTTIAQHGAATDSGATGTETVTTGADKVAGLERALHENLELS